MAGSGPAGPAPAGPAPPRHGLADAATLPVQLALGVAYPFLAHMAGTRGGAWSALALADLVLLMLAGPLLRRRWWALGLLVLLLAPLSWWVGSTWLDLLLLLPPVLFTAWLAWWFARSLLGGRVPLVTRIVAALYAQAGWSTPPALLAYARRLTAAWAGLLLFLALANAALALCAVPGGVLHAFGVAPPVAVSHAAWSWFANLLNYGLVGGFMLAEFQYRKRHFPQRPYRNGVDFARRMAALGPAFWRDLLG
ncbi:COG4648 family protein [Pseudoxanthomonas sp. 10H]|uniref:ketosynthase n=1 Tax=Pseudoxanthomonas sp. 10H TaxID=3242729 RepID=UPI0035582A35